MPNEYLQRMVSIARPACVAAALLLTGCGEDPLREDSQGYVDLVPFFTAGATAANPTLGLPRVISPSRGWANGRRIEFYNFGNVTMPRLRGPTGSALATPDAAPVPPMYFFYDNQGRPLFSKPVYDARSGVWFMRGGKNTLDPSPIAAPADSAAYFALPYVARPKGLLVDDVRGVADYQRPVVDVMVGQAGYVGVWEVVEVTVEDSSYEIDGVKSGKLVQKGIDSGKLRANRTGKVVNCPIVDDRTAVQPSALHNNIPRPRIEIWYRTLRGSCYLANGWETIGETIDPAQSATDWNNVRLLSAGAARINTFDVVAQEVGAEEDRDTIVSVPPARIYTPTVAVSSGSPAASPTIVRYVNDDVVVALPRHTAADPAGYSPLAWLYDLNVPQDPPYQAGTFKDFAAVDPAATVARNGTVTQNIAIIGEATSCKSDADCKFGLTCNTMPDLTIATSEPPTGQNVVDQVIQREGGPRCDVPVVGFGGYCATGVSRCDVQAPAGSENEKRLKALGVATAGPAFTLHADLKTAETNLANAQSLAMGVDPKDAMRVVTDAEKMAAQASIAGLESTAAGLRTRVAYYDGLGFTTDFGGWGYLCYPGATGGPAGVGSCQIRCNSGAAAGTVTEVKSTIAADDGVDTEYTFNAEPRCGGANLLGYRCLPTGSNVPARQRVCLRECQRASDPPATLAFDRALCEFPLNVKADAQGNPNSAFSLSADLKPMTQIHGQTCASTTLSSASTSTGSSTVRACIWNPDFYPLDPQVWPGQ